MGGLVKGKFIEDGAIDSSKVKLENDAFLKGRNAADDGDVSIIKVNTSDDLELAAKLNDPSSAAPTTDTQLANKKYVDDQVGAISIPSVFSIEGNWDADTNTPTLASSTNGTGETNPLYIVNVAGSTTLDGISTWDAGDWIYFANGVWNRADNIDDVISVNGQTGAVSLDADDISDAATTNKFVTAAQKVLIDASVQPGDNISTLTNDSAFVDAAGAKTAAVVNSSAGSETDQAMSVAAAKAYTDAASQTFGEEILTLSAGDITNGYKDLAQEIVAGSLHVTPSGGILLELTEDYTLSTVSTVTRVTWVGAFASVLEAGDEIIFKYAY